MVRMNSFSEEFLRDNLPEALNETDVCKVLDELYDLIDMKGFGPPSYEEYNDFGREAQKVYDDIYLCAEEDAEAESEGLT